MTQLYVLAQEYRAAAERLAALELDEQTIADTLEGLEGDLTVKGTAVAQVIRNLESTAAAIKSAECDMATRRKAIEARASSLSRYLLNSMQHAGLKKIESPHFSLAVRTNPVSVDIFDPKQIPEAFMHQPSPPPATPDKKALREAIEGGIEIPGARLVRLQRLEIK